jgi:transcription elongation factor Elf1
MNPKDMIKQGELIDCPRCDSAKAMNVTPLTQCDREMAVFYCSSCGLTFNSKGRHVVKNSTELSKLFAEGKDLRMTVDEVLCGESVSKATRSLILAKVVSYGYEMWLRGFKQGLVAATTEEEWGIGKDRNERSGDAGGASQRGSKPHAGDAKSNVGPNKNGV